MVKKQNTKTENISQNINWYFLSVVVVVVIILEYQEYFQICTKGKTRKLSVREKKRHDYRQNLHSKPNQFYLKIKKIHYPKTAL